MGGNRVAGQDMTLIYTLPVGMTWATTPIPTSTDATNVITLKRVGANEVVYSVTIGATPLVATNTFTLTGATVTSAIPALAPAVAVAGQLGVGSVVDLQVKLLDQVETACVDNAGLPANCFLTSRVASVANASDFWNNAAVPAAVGVASDLNNTTTNVNATIPLAGFLANLTFPADTATVAAAAVEVRTALGPRDLTNTANYALVAGDLVTVTVTDPTSFLGLAATAGALSFGTLPMTINALAPTTASTAATAGNNIIDFNRSTTDATAVPPTTYASAPNTVSYTSNATTPMGTSRVLSIAGAVAPAAGIAHAFTPNATWWTWNSNGTILETPFFTNAVGYTNRFVFMNYSANAVTYTATCLVETGVTATPVLPTALIPNASTGTLAANAQTVINSTNVCTVAGTALAPSTRGAVRFTINAPSSAVKGIYNSYATVSGNMDSAEMTRPTTFSAQF